MTSWPSGNERSRNSSRDRPGNGVTVPHTPITPAGGPVVDDRDSAPGGSMPTDAEKAVKSTEAERAAVRDLVTAARGQGRGPTGPPLREPRGGASLRNRDTPDRLLPTRGEELERVRHRHPIDGQPPHREPPREREQPLPIGAVRARRVAPTEYPCPQAHPPEGHNFAHHQGDPRNVRREPPSTPKSRLTGSRPGPDGGDDAGILAAFGVADGRLFRPRTKWCTSPVRSCPRVPVA